MGPARVSPSRPGPGAGSSWSEDVTIPGAQTAQVTVVTLAGSRHFLAVATKMEEAAPGDLPISARRSPGGVGLSPSHSEPCFAGKVTMDDLAVAGLRGRVPLG